MKKSAFFVVFMLLMFCAAHKNAQAQGVVTGISICEYNIPSNVVNGYSETVNDYVASLYYGVYTEGYLYKNLNLLQSFASGPASVSAIVLTQDPNAVQDTQYDLFTNHYVVCIYYVDAFPNYYGRDVLGYNFLSNVDVPNSYPFSASGPEAFLLNTVYEYLGSTRVTVGYFPPRLDFINPNWGYERGQVDVTLTGHNVDAGNFNTPVRVNVTGGITATVLSINPTTLTARFQVPDNLTGEQQVTITSTHGTSNPLNFFAVDRQPQITGISPSTIDAGTTATVTIDGTDFGANPDVEILGGAQYSITSRSDTRVVVDVSIPVDAPGGALLITVISRGANGGGFLPGPPNTSPRSNTEDIQVRAKPSISSLEPSRGLIGQTHRVIIKGDGFNDPAGVNVAGSGITATVNSVGPRSIVVDFAVAADAGPGNHGVSVTVNGQTSNSANFFVQIPKTLKRDQITEVIDIDPGPGEIKDLFDRVLVQNACGAYRNLKYTLLDQDDPGKPIIFEDGVEILEQFSDYQGPEDLKDKLVPANDFTNNAGELADTIAIFGQSSNCPPQFMMSFKQSFKAKIGDKEWPLTTVNAISIEKKADGTYTITVTQQ